MARALVIGAGHNGLICAAYLARAGFEVEVLERRAMVGGACVTEELWPGFHVSRAAYVVSLLRPQIVRELELARHGLVLLPRRPSSVTPLPDGRSLVLGPDAAANHTEIARFSTRDADAYLRYEAFLARMAAALEPTLDVPPPELGGHGLAGLRSLFTFGRAAVALGRDLPRAARVLVGPARELLCEWFDSEPLRATLATDAVIGAFAAPSQPGTGYVLFHHVMGALGGERGVWAYVRGGMGALSDAVAAAARAAGARIETEVGVASLMVERGRTVGVVTTDGREHPAEVVVSSLDPAASLALLPDRALVPDAYRRTLDTIDYRSPVVKINLALSRPPRLRVTDRAHAPLSGTIHVGALELDAIETAFADAVAGRVSTRPIVELTIPSSVDPTLAPAGKAVASIFAQYAPALPMDDARWPRLGVQMRDRAIALVDEIAPGFADSVEQVDTLTPPDLQRIFGLTGGNIFHGAMTPDRLLSLRPVPHWAWYRTPLAGYHLCGSGTHPGGGVLGATGRNAAREIIRAGG